MLYNKILLKMADIQLIVILCVLLMFSDSISFLCSFLYASRTTSLKRCCNSKQGALASKFNVSFFLVVIWYLLPKNGDIEINPGPIVPYALMMKELEFDSRIKVLRQNLVFAMISTALGIQIVKVYGLS